MKTAKKIAKTAVQRFLGVTDYEFRRKSRAAPTGPLLGDALLRLSQRTDLHFNSVIDVGASDGRWSLEVMKRYPSVNYSLIEAQPVHEPALQAFCGRHRNARYTLMAAGDQEGEIYFDAADPLGGVASRTPAESVGLRVPMTTIDAQVKRQALPPPYLIKLDTHGFELPILRGAVDTLKATSVLIIECYNFRITSECLLFHEMCHHLAPQGFRCMDMYDLLYRPHDLAFWQMDILFTKIDRPEYAHGDYR